VARCNRRKTDDPPIVDSHVRHADVVLELILASELSEETIELRIAGVKSRAVISFAKRPNLHFA
jgi:hypothetical protein